MGKFDEALERLRRTGKAGRNMRDANDMRLIAKYRNSNMPMPGKKRRGGAPRLPAKAKP